jgi:hypothetical protein
MALEQRAPSGDGSVTEVASGIDALYLSGRAELSENLFRTLEERRQAAAEADAAVPLQLAGEEFGVEPRSFGRYRYRLAHRSGLVGVTDSDNLPALRVQPRAEFLHGVGVEPALRFFERIGEYLAGGPVSWTLSRIDLFCDVQGWTLAGDDRHRFVCRGHARTTHEENEDFTGLEFGRRTTKTVMARIYDKTHEIDRKGLDWWPTIWGDRFDPSRPVTRIEFEFGRQGLSEYRVDTPNEGIESAGRLWRSVSSDWLSYRSPTSDGTKSRWPVAPEWEAVQAASLATDAVGLERIRSARRQGELRKLLPQLVGYTASVGAIIGTNDASSTLGALRSLIADDERRRGVPFEDRVAERVAARTYS